MKRATIFSITLIVFLAPSFLFAERLNPESYYVNEWCFAHWGEVEVTFPDKTRCDCVTELNAIEFDFADKWYEAVGQSLHYGLQAEKKAGIVLIVETETDLKYWKRLVAVKKYYKLPITLWKTGP